MNKRADLVRTILRVVGTVAAILYIVFLVGERTPLFRGVTFAEVSVYLLFLVFVAGYYFLWRNELVSGIILLAWHGLQWILVWWVWVDGGMTLILGIPIAVFGLVVLIHALRRRRSQTEV